MELPREIKTELQNFDKVDSDVEFSADFLISEVTEVLKTKVPNTNVPWCRGGTAFKSVNTRVKRVAVWKTRKNISEQVE